MKASPFLLAALSFFCLAFLNSCERVYFTHTSTPNRTHTPGQTDDFSHEGRNKYPPYAGVVAVYESKEQLKEFKYEVLGLVTATSRYEVSEEESQLLISLQNKAAAMGANAILLIDRDQEGDKVLNRMKAQAIRIIKYGTS